MTDKIKKVSRTSSQNCLENVRKNIQKIYKKYKNFEHDEEIPNER